MKKLMISVLLVLGIHQTTTPMFAAARAAIAARVSKSTMTNLMVNAILPTAGSMVAMHFGMKPLTDLVSHAGFRAHNGLDERHWLLQGKDFVYSWLGEIQNGMALAGLVMGGASAAYSVAKGTPTEEQQAAAQSGAIAVPGANGQITPEMREARHRENRELLARVGYKPLVIRANQ